MSTRPDRSTTGLSVPVCGQTWKRLGRPTLYYRYGVVDMAFVKGCDTKAITRTLCTCHWEGVFVIIGKELVILIVHTWLIARFARTYSGLVYLSIITYLRAAYKTDPKSTSALLISCRRLTTGYFKLKEKSWRNHGWGIENRNGKEKKKSVWKAVQKEHCVCKIQMMSRCRHSYFVDYWHFIQNQNQII